MSKREFQTEVNQLLQLIVHSLYSHPEIFLRELVSNASDALDKLNYLTLTEEPYKALVFEPRIDLELDEAQNKLTVSDTGIGMNDADLADHLGTIARSGTKNFLSSLSGDAKRDSNLIGQFGVGFYSAFMVADRVEVVSRKATEDNAWRWTSKDFSVNLRPPIGAAAQGAVLNFAFSFPQVAVDKLHSVTVSATVNRTALPPQTYSAEGQAEYKRDIASNLLSGDSVRVDFHLDKAMPPGNGDMRQLGVIARSVGLDAK